MKELNHRDRMRGQDDETSLVLCYHDLVTILAVFCYLSACPTWDRHLKCSSCLPTRSHSAHVRIPASTISCSSMFALAILHCHAHLPFSGIVGMSRRALHFALALFCFAQSMIMVVLWLGSWRDEKIEMIPFLLAEGRAKRSVGLLVFAESKNPHGSW